MLIIPLSVFVSIELMKNIPKTDTAVPNKIIHNMQIELGYFPTIPPLEKTPKSLENAAIAVFFNVSDFSERIECAVNDNSSNFSEKRQIPMKE